MPTRSLSASNGPNGAGPAADANALRPAHARAPRQKAARARAEARPAEAENIVQPARVPTRARAERAPPASPPPKAPRRRTPDARTIPEEVRRRFVQVGRDYYFADGARAFSDRGRALTTPSENTEVIRSLVSIAQARGWEAVTVSGTERFRKEAWMAARLAGLGVRGYAASAFEQQRLVQLLARAAAKAMTPGPDSPRRESASAHSRTPKSRARPNTPHERPRRGELLTGVLIDHGPARYRDHPQEAMSYFVKLETERGERKIWGVDLERALRESLTKPQIGEAVGLRAVRQDAVTVKSRERDATGAVIAEKNLATHRNRWIIEKRAFLDERAAAARTVRDASIAAPRAVREHPELAGTYAQLRAADLTARGMRDRADRELFVARVRNALADAIARGEPLPVVRLRERAAARAPATPGRDPPRQPAPTR